MLQHGRRPTIASRHGMVAAAHPLAAAAGARVLGGGATHELRGQAALYPEWSRNYLEGISGGRPSLGAVLKQPDLAKTLEALAAAGPGLLYGGELGKKVIERLAELGGCLTMDDLLDTKPHWIDPVPAGYRGRTIHVPPPPSDPSPDLLTLPTSEAF